MSEETTQTIDPCLVVVSVGAAPTCPNGEPVTFRWTKLKIAPYINNSYADARKVCTDMGGRLCTKAELCPGGTRLVVDGNIGGWTPVDESFQAISGCGNHPGVPGWGTSSSNPYFDGVACCCPGSAGASPLHRTSLAHSLFLPVCVDLHTGSHTLYN